MELAVSKSENMCGLETSTNNCTQLTGSLISNIVMLFVRPQNSANSSKRPQNPGRIADPTADSSSTHHNHQ